MLTQDSLFVVSSHTNWHWYRMNFVLAKNFPGSFIFICTPPVFTVNPWLIYLASSIYTFSYTSFQRVLDWIFKFVSWVGQHGIKSLLVFLLWEWIYFVHCTIDVDNSFPWDCHASYQLWCSISCWNTSHLFQPIMSPLIQDSKGIVCSHQSVCWVQGVCC